MLHNSKLALPKVVDGCQGDSNITEMWRTHYELLLNCVTDDSHKDELLHVLNGISESDFLSITPDQVLSALKNSKRGKSCGLDGLATEHFIFADNSLCVHLALLFSSVLSHGYLPRDFMLSAIIPIIKNKTGDVSAKNNYRPVASVTACSKLFEIILLDIIQEQLHTCDNQFGFKSKHSTDMCVFVLKSVVDYYHKFGSSVFTCF